MLQKPLWREKGLLRTPTKKLQKPSQKALCAHRPQTPEARSKQRLQQKAREGCAKDGFHTSYNNNCGLKFIVYDNYSALQRLFFRAKFPKNSFPVSCVQNPPRVPSYRLTISIAQNKINSDLPPNMRRRNVAAHLILPCL